MLRVFYLERHEKTHRLKGVKSFVNVVAQEDVLFALHLLVVRKTEVLEQPEQIMELSVNTSEYLDWGSHTNQTLLAPHYLHRILAQPHHLVLFEGKKRGIAVFLFVVGQEGLDDPLCKLNCAEVG